LPWPWPPPTPAAARPAAQNANEAATARHYAALIAGSQPKTAELTMFFTQMPKGGDLHHHYSGAVYAETYVDFLDKQGYCVNKQTYKIETDKAIVDAERAKPAKDRNCLGTADVYADDYTYRELLQRWSSKDFHNHGAIQAPPDRQFFQTFLLLRPGLERQLPRGPGRDQGTRHPRKRRLHRDHVQDVAVRREQGLRHPGLAERARRQAFEAQMRAWMTQLDADQKFNQSIADFTAKIDEAAAGIDDERFTMRYQTYVLRLLNPSQVFSSMLAGFKAAKKDSKIVGVNIVGQESQMVSMRDYTLHMQMFHFLKSVYPDVKVALHAGELALGDVPPEELQYHIDEALNLAGADRIGHGIDLAHETNAAAIMQRMREKDIPVEINLTSNAFINGVQGENHPITLYRKYGVPYVISTDDAGVTRHNLANEYVLFASPLQAGVCGTQEGLVQQHPLFLPGRCRQGAPDEAAG
jgi:adenosine deaminase